MERVISRSEKIARVIREQEQPLSDPTWDIPEGVLGDYILIPRCYHDQFINQILQAVGN